MNEALLADQTRILGPDHGCTLSTRNNLAYTYMEAGDSRKAVKMYTDLLADYTRTLGLDHPKTRAFSAELTYLKNEKWRRENCK